nr:DUF998 domain-containing protein [Nocardioides zeae]
MLYANFLLAWSNGPRGTWLDVVSDLEAVGEPDAYLLRITDLVCVVLVLALLPAARSRLRPGWAREASTWLTVLFCAGAALAAVVPKPGDGPGASTAPGPGPSTLVHDSASILSDSALFLGVAAAWVALDPRAWPRLRRVAVVVLLGGGIGASLAFAWFDRTGEPWWAAGVTQRIHIVSISVWMVALGVLAAGRRTGPGAEHETEEAGA